MPVYGCVEWVVVQVWLCMTEAQMEQAEQELR